MDGNFQPENDFGERLRRRLRILAVWAIAGIVAGALFAGVWYWKTAGEERAALEASRMYRQLTQALNKNDMGQAQAIGAGLERKFPDSPYVNHVRLFNTRLAIEAGDLSKAGALLREVMADTKDRPLALVARLRLARVQLAQNEPDTALATLDGTEPGAFAARFHEVRGDVLLAKGNKQGALKEYEAAQGGDASPSVDVQSLKLKIDDIKGAAPAAAAAPSR